VIPERITFVSRGITVIMGTLVEIARRFRLTNVIPERIIFVSGDITIQYVQWEPGCSVLTDMTEL